MDLPHTYQVKLASPTTKDGSGDGGMRSYQFPGKVQGEARHFRGKARVKLKWKGESA